MKPFKTNLGVLVTTLLVGLVLSQTANGFRQKPGLEPSMILLKSNSLSDKSNSRRGFPDLVYNDRGSQFETPPVSGQPSDRGKPLDEIQKNIPHQNQSPMMVEEGGETPSKRFNEFVGKRTVLPLTPDFTYSPEHEQTQNLAWKNTWNEELMYNQKGLLSPSKVTPTLRTMTSLPTPEFQQVFTDDKEIMLSNFLKNLYKYLMLKTTPKRQYDFVGKRHINLDGTKMSPELEEYLAKRYDLIGKKRFAEFMGKRYDFLGKKSLSDFMAKRYDFIGKKNMADFMAKRYDFLGKRGLAHPASKRYDFLGKKNFDEFLPKRYDFLGKREYDYLGKKNDIIENMYRKVAGKQRLNELLNRKRYDFLGKRYDFIGKRYDLIGKRYDFIGKRSSWESKAQEKGKDGVEHYNKMGLEAGEMNGGGKENENGMKYTTKDLGSKQSFGDDAVFKRYSEWLGKKKRTVEIGRPLTNMSDSQRLAALLRNNTLRKRLSRMLLHSRLQENNNTPEFIGKR